MAADITTGASREDVLAWGESLENYVNTSIVEPLINGIGNVFSSCLYYYWCSDNAVTFRKEQVGITKHYVQMIMTYCQALRNTVYSAYNLVAGQNNAEKITYDDAGSNTVIYDVYIEGKLVELREKNDSNRFGMNVQAINTLVIPQLNTIKEDILSTIDGIPNVNGIFDETGAIQTAYNSYIGRITENITTIIDSIITGINDKIDQEVNDSTIAVTNAESTFNG